MTPSELARELGISPKTLRSWLREQWPPAQLYARWDLMPEQVDSARQRFAGSALPRRDLEVVLGKLATWSEWRSWQGARAEAPRLPGVYLLRVADKIVYVGKAGERSGREGLRAPQGLWGRLGRYESGKAATSGFGEAALDRALAQADFVRARLNHLETIGPQRTTVWAQEAITWFSPDVRWTVTGTGLDAFSLEGRVESALTAAGVELWNRPRQRSSV